MNHIKRSLFWSAVDQLGSFIISFSITVVLARLLEPSDFGLIGMMALFIGLANTFSDSGFSTALIQRKTITADDETSVFALNITAGVILAILLYLVSPLVAEFYHQPILVPLLSVNALTIILSSFAIVQRTLLQRNMQFKRIAAISLVSMVISGVSAIYMANNGFGVWSLLGQSISAILVSIILYWILSPWRPLGKVRWQSINSMWSYSSNVLGSRIIGVVYQNMYSVIIGKNYSPESLGFYNRANNLRMLPVGILSAIVHKVAFPYFSKYQDDKVLILRNLREIIRNTLLLSTSVITLLYVIADPLLPLLLTDKWRQVIPLFRILCYAAIIYPVSALYLMILQAQGYANLMFRLESLKMVYGVIVVALVFRYGVDVLAWSVVVTTVISYFLNVWFNVKLIGYRWRMQAFDILPTIILCACSGLATWWIGSLYSVEPFVVMLIQCGVFIALILIGVYMFRRIFFTGIWKYLI